VLPGRRWSDGLHQAIEAKERVEIQPETQTLATITYQNMFLLYPKLAGMTGLPRRKKWSLRRFTIGSDDHSTNRPTTRHDLSDMVFKTEEAKWRAVAEECAQMHEAGDRY